MNKSKLIKIVLGLVVILLFLYSLFYILSKKKPGANLSINNPPAGKTTVVGSKDGGTVSVRDFTQNPVQQIKDTTVIASSDLYRIVYYSKDSSFTIVLQNLPLAYARQQAQSELLSKLNIDQNTACTLKLAVTVPVEVSSQYAGQNLGLSFCPGSTSLNP